MYAEMGLVPAAEETAETLAVAANGWRQSISGLQA